MPAKAKSRRVGYTHRTQWPNWVVYEALQPLVCGKCGRTIAVGERFTRRGVHKDGEYRQRPVCRQCEPWEDGP
jgi:hypothetical protein